MFIQKPFSLTTTTGTGDAYVPEGSMWFEKDDLSYMSKLFTASPTGGGKKWTFSVWLKRSGLWTTGQDQGILIAHRTQVKDADYNEMIKFASKEMGMTWDKVSGTSPTWTGIPMMRDPSTWFHYCVVVDTTQAVSESRWRFYLNGNVIGNNYGTPTYPTLDEVGKGITSNYGVHEIGRNSNAGYTPLAGYYYNGYMSEMILLDGYVGLPTDFGEFDTNGIWRPVNPTTVVTDNKGNNGFWIDFRDNTNLGNDYSYSGLSVGNDNSFTSNNITSANYSLDRPAGKAEDTGNYCTLSTSYKVGTGQYLPLANGSLTFYNSSFGRGTQAMGTIGMSSGKFYWEVSWSAIPIELASRVGIAQINDVVGSGSLDGAGTEYLAGTAGSWAFLAWESGANAGKKETNGTKSSYYDSTTDISDTIGVAFDADNGAIWISKNGSWIDGSVTGQSSATVLASIETYANTYVMFDGLTDGPYIPGVSFDGSAGTGEINFGQTAFTYTPPSGFKKLNTSNMSEPTVKNGEDNFSPILFEGNGTGQRVGNFIPFTDSHTVSNSARFDEGSTQYLTRSVWGTSTDTTKWTVSMWVKRGKLGKQRLGDAGSNASNQNILDFTATDALDFQLYVAPNFGRLTSYRLFKETDTWIHLVFVHDSSNGTGDDKMRMYVNGVRITNLSVNTNPTGNLSVMTINGQNTSFGYDLINSLTPYDGYMSEVIFVDGYALDASPFGQTDTSTNRWIPKEVTAATLNTAGGGTSGFGTNGFYLNMADKNDLGDDESPNTNDFTMTNMDTTNGSNQMYDTPTRNFNVLNPADTGGGTLTEGNLKITPANLAGIRATIGIELNTGKYYWESLQGASGGEIGWYSEDCNVSTSGGGQSNGAGNWNINFNGRYHANPIGGTLTTSSDQTAWAFTTNDVIMCAYDSDTGNLWFGKNGTWFDSVSGSSGDTGNPSTGANPFLTGVNTKIFPMVGDGTGTAANIQTVNFGSWIYFDSTTLSLSTDPAGYFRYTVPTDFKAINQDNLPENTAGITGFAWFKERDGVTNHLLWDRVNGIYKYVISNTNDVQGTDTNGLKSFLQQGADIGNMSSINDAGDSMVLWQWVAGGTSTPSVNTDAGFSIAKYTGNGTGGNTVTHSLGVAPEFICVKKLAAGDDATSRHWAVYHVSQGNTKYALLSDSNAFATSSGYWNDTTPGTSTFTVGTDDSVNGNNAPYVAYCWAGVDGYSQFGEYIGNGNADGPIINLGFKPSFVLIKAAERSNNWHIFDSARNPYNQITNDALFPDLDIAEGGTNAIDFGGNFFKLRTAEVWLNASSSNKYIYAAFAENPFGGSGVAQVKAR